MKNKIFTGLVSTSLLFGGCSDSSATNNKEVYQKTNITSQEVCEEPSVLGSEGEFIKSDACKKVELDIKIRIAKAHLKEAKREERLRDKEVFCDDESKGIDSAGVYGNHDCSYSGLAEDQPTKYIEKVKYNPGSINISIHN